MSIASVAYGGLLGVFLLGTLTRYATQGGAIVGMVCGFAVNMILWLQSLRLLPNPLAGVHFPAVAFTWYVLIGAIVTFAVGSAVSFIRPKRDVGAGERKVAARLAGVLIVALVSGLLAGPVRALEPAEEQHGSSTHLAERYDFSGVSAAVNQAIAANKLPGAVVLVGHGGKTVFEQAFGNRAVEPTVEPMTVDTIFDMASLTKCLATATAVMQLHEQRKLGLDDTVVKYLPEFGVNGKEKVTIRELLTHYSGLPEDVSLKDDVGAGEAG